MATASRRKKDYTYKLMVDPDRLKLGNTLRDKLLRIMIKHGGVVSREKLLIEFEKKVRQRLSKTAITASSLLSRQQRILQDKGILKIYNENGEEIFPKTRVELLL